VFSKQPIKDEEKVAAAVANGSNGMSLIKMRKKWKAEGFIDIFLYIEHKEYRTTSNPVAGQL